VVEMPHLTMFTTTPMFRELLEIEYSVDIGKNSVLLSLYKHGIE
jgi:hypothetical protein